MQKKYRVKIANKEIEILQDNDGKFIKPNFIKELETEGTALKPAHEPILLARKPISERNIASNVLKWGCGGINVDGCRINVDKKDKENIFKKHQSFENTFSGNIGVRKLKENEILRAKEKQKEIIEKTITQGRFPANLILECCCEDDELVDGKAGELTNYDWGDSEQGAVGLTNNIKSGRHYKNEQGAIHTNPNCVCRMLDEQSGECKTSNLNMVNTGIWGSCGKREHIEHKGSSGGASRYFYQAKASQKERWFYCTICKQAYQMKERDNHIHGAPEKTKYQYLEFHPTQKPSQLIQYLARLITPPNGTMLDPFLGSGTGLIAAEREGFNCVGIDSKREYCLISHQRLKTEIEQEQTKLSGGQSTIERIGF